MPKYNVDVNYYYTISYKNEIEVEAKSKGAAESKVEKLYEDGKLDFEEALGIGVDDLLFQIEDVDKL